MIRFIRDMDFQDDGSYIATSDDDNFEELVKKVYPRAYLKRTEEPRYVYQVRVKTGLFSSYPIGDKSAFKDLAWKSAYVNALKTK